MNSLTEGGFHMGCIAGHNGQVWGATPSFKMVPYEIQTLAKVLDNDEEAINKIKTRGFTVQGMPYALNRLENSEDTAFLIGRCKEHGAPSRGAIVARTAQTIIVGVHDPLHAGNRSFGKGHVAIFQLAESLAGMNF